MKDNEIIKILPETMKDVLDLIKQQQAEIERLNSLCTSKEIGADDMGRYDHYTDTFIKERGKR